MSCRHSIVAWGVALACAACGDSPSSPGGGIDVEVAVAVLAQAAPEIEVDGDGFAAIWCTATLRASATGTHPARWSDATIRWFIGTTRDVVNDSIAITTAEVDDLWNGPRVTAGGFVTGDWTLGASVPFTAEIEFGYHRDPTGDIQRTTVRFDCGPRIAEGVALPTVESISVTASRSVVEPGDSLTVGYSAAAPAGLWQTFVVITGHDDCVTVRGFAERMSPSVTRTAKIRIPPDCPVGESPQVSVVAEDPAGRLIARPSLERFTLVDLTPPFLGRRGGIPPPGEWLDGETVPIEFGISDHGGLRALVWEAQPAGAIDSVTLDGRLVESITLRVPVRREWAGRQQLRFFARDAVGLASDTITVDSILVHAATPVMRPMLFGSLGGEVIDFAIDEKRNELFFAEPGFGRLVVADAISGQIRYGIALPSYPTSVALSHGGDSLLVAIPSRRAIAVLDLRVSPAVPQTLPVRGLDEQAEEIPRTIRVAANGRVFIGVTSDPTGRARLFELDLATGQATLRPDAGITGRVIESAGDESTLVFTGSTSTCLHRYEALTNAFGPCRPIAEGRTTLDATGRRLAVGRTIYDATLTPMTVATSPRESSWIPRMSVLAPSGEDLFYGEHILLRASATDGAILDGMRLPWRADIARLSTDGTRLYVAGRGNTDGFAIIDLRR